MRDDRHALAPRPGGVGGEGGKRTVCLRWGKGHQRNRQRIVRHRLCLQVLHETTSLMSCRGPESFSVLSGRKGCIGTSTWHSLDNNLCLPCCRHCLLPWSFSKLSYRPPKPGCLGVRICLSGQFLRLHSMNALMRRPQPNLMRQHYWKLSAMSRGL